MSGAHQPREAFVDRLEAQLRAELRRGDSSPGGFWWLPRSRAAFAAGMAAVVVISMAVGGGAVAAAYEARLSEQRETLVSTLQQRAAIAHQRLELVRKQLESVRQRVSVGIEPPRSILEAEVRVKEAETALKLVQIDIEEVKATGQEPKHAVSSPLVAGRDFVLERWQVEQALPTAALSLETTRLQEARGRFEIGTANPRELDDLAVRIAELEVAVKTVQQKIALRQAFLKGGVPAAAADLRGLEVETEGRRLALARRIAVARKQLDNLRSRVEVGTANPFQVAEAELQLQEMQLTLTKADYDLLLIRKQIGK
jgi:hypothetical protein